MQTIQIPLSNAKLTWEQYTNEVAAYMEKHFPNIKYTRDGKDMDTAFVVIGG